MNKVYHRGKAIVRVVEQDILLPDGEEEIFPWVLPIGYDTQSNPIDYDKEYYHNYTWEHFATGAAGTSTRWAYNFMDFYEEGIGGDYVPFMNRKSLREKTQKPLYDFIESAGIDFSNFRSEYLMDYRTDSTNYDLKYNGNGDVYGHAAGLRQPIPNPGSHPCKERTLNQHSKYQPGCPDGQPFFIKDNYWSLR